MTVLLGFEGLILLVSDGERSEEHFSERVRCPCFMLQESAGAKCTVFYLSYICWVIFKVSIRVHV